MRVLRDIFVLSVSGGPGAQELQSMMFYPKKKGPILCARKRQGPRGFPKSDGLESRGNDP